MSGQPNNTEKLLARQRRQDAVAEQFRKAAQDVSIYLTGGKVNAGTVLAVIEYAMGIAYWETKNSGRRIYRPEIFAPLLAGLATVEDPVALEAAIAFTLNMGRDRDPDVYPPVPDDLLKYIEAAQQTGRRVDRLAAPKRRQQPVAPKTELQRPTRIILERPTA
jgi:hypothetical protein